ncbi:MAG TPA: LCP family protein [Candidatus Saccharimonadales bacterium]|nr:LCP family protein [Candidatus Saccharimonadales bacterium]
MSKQFYDYYRPDEDGLHPRQKPIAGSDVPGARSGGRRQITMDGLQEEPDRTKKPSRREARKYEKQLRKDGGLPPDQQGFGEPPKKKRRWLKRTLWALFTLIFIALVGASWVGWKFLKETTKVFGGTPLGNAAKLMQPTTLSGEDAGHVNILIAGNSVDDPGHGGASLTDSIMVLSINTHTKQGYMFSVPRDLWVNISGEGYAKINDVYPLGNSDNFHEAGYPDGGMGLLEKTIQEHFKIPINYYALVNYTALKNIVNAVGGIDVNIQSTDPRGLYDPNINVNDGGPLRLPNGVNHLDGQTALNLARARGDPTGDGRVAYGFPRSDFDRTQHQRQLLVAIQGKMQSAGVLINPIKLGHVLDGIGNNVTTDLKINEARKLVGLVRGIGTGNMQSLALASDTKNYLKSYSAPGGQSALIPAAGINDYSEIQGYIQPLLGSL